MTAEQSRRRAWFQLHLSTCVVLMILAGGWMWMVWFNLYGSTSIQAGYLDEETIVRFEHYSGWPFRVYYFTEGPSIEPHWYSVVKKEDYPTLYDAKMLTSLLVTEEDWLWLGIAGNLLFAVAFSIGLVWLASQFHRRADGSHKAKS